MRTGDYMMVIGIVMGFIVGALGAHHLEGSSTAMLIFGCFGGFMGVLAVGSLIGY